MTLVPKGMDRSRREGGATAARRSRLGRPPLWIRTSAGPKIGFGHLRRSLILSRVLADCVAPVFLCDDDEIWCRTQCEAVGWPTLPYHPIRVWNEQPLPHAIIIDTREKAGLIRLISEAKKRSVPVVSIHDLGLNPLPSDIVIDGSIVPVHPDFHSHGEAFYPGPSYLVLEPGFALLHQKPRHQSERIGRIIVGLGGGDTKVWFQKVLRGLQAWERRIEVVGIPGFTNWGQVEILQRDWSPLRFRWASSSETPERLVPRADLAIMAGGLSAYEALCAGTPLMAVALDRYQRATISALSKAGACLDLGLATDLRPKKITAALALLDIDPQMRIVLAAKGQALVDGRGAERVAGLIRLAIQNRACPPNPRSAR